MACVVLGIHAAIAAVLQVRSHLLHTDPRNAALVLRITVKAQLNDESALLLALCAPSEQPSMWPQVAAAMADAAPAAKAVTAHLRMAVVKELAALTREHGVTAAALQPLRAWAVLLACDARKPSFEEYKVSRALLELTLWMHVQVGTCCKLCK